MTLYLVQRNVKLYNRAKKQQKSKWATQWTKISQYWNLCSYVPEVGLLLEYKNSQPVFVCSRCDSETSEANTSRLLGSIGNAYIGDVVKAIRLPQHVRCSRDVARNRLVSRRTSS